MNNLQKGLGEAFVAGSVLGGVELLLGGPAGAIVGYSTGINLGVIYNMKK